MPTFNPMSIGGRSSSPNRAKQKKPQRRHDDEEGDSSDDDDGDGPSHLSDTGNSIDPCGVCPSYEQFADGSLVNRLLFSLFAVTLLWVSSLTVATHLTTWIVTAPQLGTVWDLCSHTYEIANKQREQYRSCVDRQLSRCDEEFVTALDEAIATVGSAFAVNEELLEVSVAGCEDATTLRPLTTLVRGATKSSSSK